MMKRTMSIWLPSLALSLLLQGCGAALVGGAVVGASIIHDRRSSGTVLDDNTIEFKIVSRLNADSELLEHSRLDAISYNYVVLLTGQTETDQLRNRYVEIARNTPMVKRVVDEVEVGPRATVTEEGRDAYITAKIKVDLLRLKLDSFDPTRVKVVTEKGVVYLLGLVTQEEATAAVERVRYISGVKRVVKIFDYI